MNNNEKEVTTFYYDHYTESSIWAEEDRVRVIVFVNWEDKSLLTICEELHSSIDYAHVYLECWTPDGITETRVAREGNVRNAVHIIDKKTGKNWMTDKG